jgi:paired amphipathic helix protein Sin3a
MYLRRAPPVDPCTNSTGPQSFYTLPNLPSLGNGVSHPPPGHTFTIPSISSTEPHVCITASECFDQVANKSQVPSELKRRPSEGSHKGLAQTLPSLTIPAEGQHQLQQQQQQQPQQHQHDAQAQVQAHGGAAVPAVVAQGVPTRSASTSVYRPLNVKDALSYLDQVKIQFFNQADVYNNFLDIMKDFKSQRYVLAFLGLSDGGEKSFFDLFFTFCFIAPNLARIGQRDASAGFQFCPTPT